MSDASHTRQKRTDRIRRLVSVLFVSLIVSAGSSCGRRPSGQPEPLVFFSLEYDKKANPLDYFPLAAGNKWTYKSIDREGIGQSGGIITIEWITEYIVTGQYNIPEGKVILGDFITQNVRYEYPSDSDVAALDWFKRVPCRGPASFRHKNYLIAGNYVFDLGDYGWDAAARGLSAKYRDDLPSAMPIFFFPLGVARVWSDRRREEADCQAGLLWEAGKGPAPNPAQNYWTIEAREDVRVPYGKVKGATKLLLHENCGGSVVWFKDGLGVVKAGFIHVGSYMEEETQLVDFTAARTTK